MNIKLIGGIVVVLLILIIIILATMTNTFGNNPPPIDGGWSQWTDDTECDAECGQGNKKKSRKCNNPSPKHGGKECVGESSMDEACKLKECPIDGGWSDWEKTKDCDAECNGKLEMSRFCKNPVPQFGGKECQGDSKRFEDCNKTCVTGRYVYVIKDPVVNEPLNIGEIDVYSKGVNISKGKNVNSYNIHPNFPSKNAVDGNQLSIIHSDKYSLKTWVAIDLGNEYPIDKIQLFNRLDCCTYRTRHIRVDIRDPKGKIVWGSTIMENFPTYTFYPGRSNTYIPDKREVFHIAGYKHKYSDAENACKAFGGTLASEFQIREAAQLNMSVCSWGWVRGNKAMLVMNRAKPGCSGGKTVSVTSEKDVNNSGWGKNGVGVWCYGIKPNKTDKIHPFSDEPYKWSRFD